MGLQVLNLKIWIDRHAIVLAIGACGMIIILGVVATVLVSGLNNTPRWWNLGDQLNADDPALISQAERLENAITTQLTAVRDVEDPQWAVAITIEQANAWLVVRLADTIQTHLGRDAWPSEVEQVRVGIEDDQLIVGARLVHASGSNIVWARVVLRIDKRADLWGVVSSVHVGTTRIPKRLFAKEEFGFAGSALKLGSGKLELGDGRQAELLGLRVHNGQLELVMKTSVIE